MFSILTTVSINTNCYHSYDHHKPVFLFKVTTSFFFLAGSGHLCGADTAVSTAAPGSHGVPIHGNPSMFMCGFKADFMGSLMAGWWYTYTSETWWSSPVGIFNSLYLYIYIYVWKVIKIMFQPPTRTINGVNGNSGYPYATHGAGIFTINIYNQLSSEHSFDPMKKMRILLPHYSYWNTYINQSTTQFCLVGGSMWFSPTPLKNDWVRQLGLWNSRMESHNPFMFQTTNQMELIEIKDS